MSSTSARAPYGPPALRIFTQTQDPQPDQAQIAAERFRRRYNVRKDNNEQLRLGRQLHPDFCLSKTDRNLAFNEAMGDIEDAVSRPSARMWRIDRVTALLRARRS